MQTADAGMIHAVSQADAGMTHAVSQTAASAETNANQNAVSFRAQVESADAEKAHTPRVAISSLSEQELQGSGLKPFWNSSKAVAIKRAKTVALKSKLCEQSQRQVPKTPVFSINLQKGKTYK